MKQSILTRSARIPKEAMLSCTPIVKRLGWGTIVQNQKQPLVWVTMSTWPGCLTFRREKPDNSSCTRIGLKICSQSSILIWRGTAISWWKLNWKNNWHAPDLIHFPIDNNANDEYGTQHAPKYRLPSHSHRKQRTSEIVKFLPCPVAMWDHLPPYQHRSGYLPARVQCKQRWWRLFMAALFPDGPRILLLHNYGDVL